MWRGCATSGFWESVGWASWPASTALPGISPLISKQSAGQNWTRDRALAAFFATSLLFVVPLSMLSDRFRLRRSFLAVSALILGTGIASLSFVEGGMILIVVALTGIVFDAFMAIYNASVLEIEGVGYLYAGTAMGFSRMIRSLGGTISPPLGNSLAVYGPSVPFLFWGGMGILAMLMFTFVLKTPPRTTQDIPE